MKQIEKLNKEVSNIHLSLILLAIVMLIFLVLGCIEIVKFKKEVAKTNIMQTAIEKITIAQANCKDSDSGVDYLTQGICDDGIINRLDYCTNNILTEYYCVTGNVRVSGNKQVCLSNDVDCTASGGRCLNGACQNNLK